MRPFVLICFLLCTCSGFSQADSTAVVADTNVHSVKKAVIFSAVVPGAGQIYNHIAMPKGRKKAYWKVPLIYAGLGATGYFMIKNNQLKNELKLEYENRQKNEPPSEEYAQYDDAGLLTLFTSARNNRDLCIIGFGLVYLLNVVDAGVEAHFVNFDISEDLSLSFHPAVMAGYTPGVSVRLNFHSKPPRL